MSAAERKFSGAETIPPLPSEFRATLTPQHYMGECAKLFVYVPRDNFLAGTSQMMSHASGSASGVGEVDDTLAAGNVER